MKNKASNHILLTLASALLLAGCSLSSNSGNPSTIGFSTGTGESSNSVSIPSIDESISSILSTSIDNSTFSISSNDATAAWTQSDNVYTITGAGVYVLQGALQGQILVQAADSDKVELDLNGVTIVYGDNSPVLALSGDKLEVKAVKDTENYIVDTRALKTVDSEEQGEGALSSDIDLKLTGKGKLTVSGSYNNGVHTSDDLSIKSQTLTVSAPNNAFKGKDSIEVLSGEIIAISSDGNGFKTDNTDVSSKGNQRGNITITGGNVNVYSAYDAFDAAYNLVIADDETEGTSPVINAYTNKYASDYVTSSTTTSTTKMYVAIPSSLYSTSYKYGICFYDGDNHAITEADYVGSKQSGGGGMRGGSRTTYHYYSVNRPTSFPSFKIYRFTSSQSISESAYDAVSSGQTVNSNYDTIRISSISNGSIALGQWTNYETQQGGGGFGPGGQSQGNTDKSTESAKGFKAANEILISGGTIYIKSYDDAIHANYGDAFDNGETGLGNVKISGGSITLEAADDALHADNTILISGGSINITKAYEGLEANFITIEGGSTKVYATDDGVNASKKINQTPQITISGGLLDVTIGQGDTDGIDTNGNFTLSGGTVVTRGGPGGGGMSTGLDCDGTAKVNSGLLICFGSPEVSPTAGSGVVKQTISGTYGAGTYTIANSSISVSTVNSTGSYSGIYIWSSYGNGFTAAKA